jgi:glucose-6-phosphate 1-epimerase
MQTLTELNEHFAIPGVLSFDEGHGGFLRANITTPACRGAIYLYGAHLVAWQPDGAEPVIFLSEHSKYEAGKAIRGGVPIIFPWFGNKDNAPTHGFARTEVWDVAFVGQSGDDLHVTLTLAPNETSRALGYDKFQLAYEVIFGKELTLRLSVANQGDQPLEFEEGLHTYLAISNIEDVAIHGLKDTEYLDKMDDFKRKRESADAIRFTGSVDRPYVNTEANVTLEDPGMKRRIVLSKQGSKTTVVWNPWSNLAATLPDLGEDEWRKMVCVEAVNAGENKITLHAKEAHTMEAKFTVQEGSA